MSRSRTQHYPPRGYDERKLLAGAVKPNPVEAHEPIIPEGGTAFLLGNGLLLCEGCYARYEQEHRRHGTAIVARSGLLADERSCGDVIRDKPVKPRTVDQVLNALAKLHRI